MKRRELITRLAGGVLTATALPHRPARAQAGRTKLVLALSVPVMDLASAYYSAVPKRLGYWEREGLDVDYLTAGGSAQSFGLLESGQAQIINVGLPTLMSVVSKSATPVGQYVTAFGNTLFMALDGGPVTSVADLRGATIGIRDLGSAALPIADGALRSAGLLPERDVNWVAVGTGGPSAEALKNGRIAAYYGVDVEFAVLQNIGIPVRAVPKTEFDKTTPNIGLMTFARDVLQTRPQAALGFLRGIAMALEFATANPVAATKIVYELHPDIRPRLPTEQALREGANIMLARLRNARPPDGGLAGDFAPGAVEAEVASFMAMGQVKERPPAVATWYRRDLIEAANQFDRAAIRAQAAAYP